jgi:hypothetical protein
MTDAARARRGLLIYFVVVATLSVVLQWRVIAGGGTTEDHGGLIMLLTWGPTLGSIIARLALREGFADVPRNPDVERRADHPDRNLKRWILPVAVLGSSARTSIQRGYFQGPAVSLTWARSSSKSGSVGS